MKLSEYIEKFGYISTFSRVSSLTLKEIESQVIALEIIEDRLKHPNHEGRWGVGLERSLRLRAVGYDYNYIQKLVNDWFINNVL